MKKDNIEVVNILRMTRDIVESDNHVLNPQIIKAINLILNSVIINFVEKKDLMRLYQPYSLYKQEEFNPFVENIEDIIWMYTRDDYFMEHLLEELELIIHKKTLSYELCRKYFIKGIILKYKYSKKLFLITLGEGFLNLIFSLYVLLLFAIFLHSIISLIILF
jgi:hypothetical protein